MAPLVRDAFAVFKMKKIAWHSEIIPAPAYRSLGQPSTRSQVRRRGPLGNTRANGVNLLAVSCHRCWHELVIEGAPWLGETPVP
jgi:hypothetical protein